MDYFVVYPNISIDFGQKKNIIQSKKINVNICDEKPL